MRKSPLILGVIFTVQLAASASGFVGYDLWTGGDTDEWPLDTILYSFASPGGECLSTLTSTERAAVEQEEANWSTYSLDSSLSLDRNDMVESRFMCWSNLGNPGPLASVNQTPCASGDTCWIKFNWDIRSQFSTNDGFPSDTDDSRLLGLGLPRTLDR